MRIPSAAAVFLIDATPDVREQLDSLRSASGADASGVDRAPLDGVLLTHAHIGHYLGLAFFGFEAVHTRDLPVYCSARMAEFLRSNGPWSQLVRLGNIALNEVRPNVPFALGGGVTATAVSVPHRDEYSDTLGFVLRGPNKSVLYVPDTDPWRAWDASFEARLDDIDVAIIDGSFWSADELPGREIEEIGHPMIRDSLDLLESRVADGSLAIYFTHLNHSNPALDPASPERAEIERRGFRVLAEGQRIPL